MTLSHPVWVPPQITSKLLQINTVIPNKVTVQVIEGKVCGKIRVKFPTKVLRFRNKIKILLSSAEASIPISPEKRNTPTFKLKHNVRKQFDTQILSCSSSQSFCHGTGYWLVLEDDWHLFQMVTFLRSIEHNRLECCLTLSNLMITRSVSWMQWRISLILDVSCEGDVIFSEL